MKAPGDFRESLASAVESWLRLPGACAASLEAHYRLLLKWNRVINLTKLADLEEAVQRHYAESLFLGFCCPARPTTLADMGSGAGFPGISLAALWPECEVTLIESDTRKASFLRECRDLLPNLRVVCVRAEDLAGQFGAVVSRAVRPVDVVKFAQGRAPLVGLLIAESDAVGLRVEKLQSFRVPGGGKGIAVWGEVPRGTIRP